jgi:ABC-type multidrug transport system fused ATPase/permease subunit
MTDSGDIRSRDFAASARRLLRRLRAHRAAIAGVLALSLGGVALSVIGPRVLGHATDLLFNGVIGRQLPAGITKSEAIAEARGRGDNNFAELLSGMDVVPGRGVDFAAVGRTLLLALIMYLVAALLIWAQSRLLNTIVARTVTTLRSDVEKKVHRLPLSYFDTRQRSCCFEESFAAPKDTLGEEQAVSVATVLRSRSSVEEELSTRKSGTPGKPGKTFDVLFEWNIDDHGIPYHKKGPDTFDDYLYTASGAKPMQKGLLATRTLDGTVHRLC